MLPFPANSYVKSEVSMKTRTLFTASLVANAVLVGAMTYVCQQMPEPAHQPADARSVVNAGSDGATSLAKPADGSPRFGPVMEILLPKPGKDHRSEMFDLETGRCLTEPDFDFFGRKVKAYVAWMQANGLDISGVVHEGREVFCVCYYMAAVPVDSKLWEAATPAEVLASPELARIHDPKRSVIMPAQAKTDTFVFRTREGATGMLQVLGATADRHSVKIRYKLVQPAVATLAQAGFALP